MNSIDSEDRLQNILKYSKYLIILIILVGLVFLIKSCDRTYDDIETDVINATKDYINKNNITITKESYIEITKLDEIEGTELCSKASGVIVKNENGNLKYQVYLDCLNYQSSNFKNKSKYIELKGDAITVLNEGEIFEDPMYILKQDADVVVSGKASTEPGIYTINYMVYLGSSLQETVSRKVIVTENDKDANISGLLNTQDPIITLMGEKNIVLAMGTKYKEEGYLAVDYEDGKITRQVKVIPNPEKIPNSPGTYVITYSVTNSKGKTAIATRKITIVKLKSNLQIELNIVDDSISNKATISGSVKGEGFNYVLLPNGTKEYSSKFTYTVTSNGIYPFKVYDNYDNGENKFNEYIKEIEVTNIDNIIPTGICSALVRGNNTEVQIQANDNKGIAGYNYILDGIESGYQNTNTYKVASASKTISVNVKDVANNVATIKCSVTIKAETTPGRVDTSSATVINTSDYTLVATRNDVVDFAKAVDSLNVAQNHPPGYGDLCLSFAYYHAYKLYNGDPFSTLSAEAASKYEFASKFTSFKSESKQEVLAKVYESINAGQPCVLHVNGNKDGTSRHYVTVVGYKSSVTSAYSITEEDLLIIDSYDGKLERMDTANSRFMITGHDTGRTGSKAYGHQVYIFR